MRVVITGATGYLGSHLARALLDRGDNVAVLSRSPSSLGRLTEVADRLKVYSYCGLGMADACADGSVDAVVNAATCYGKDGESACAMVEANVVRPLRVALAAGTRVGRWIDIGSALPPDVSPYALSKAQFASWLTTLPAALLAPRYCLPFQHFYGPGDDPRKFTTHVMRCCLLGQDLELTTGTQRRDFIYITDATSAVLAVLDCAQSTGLSTSIPVGSGEAITVRRFVEQVHGACATGTVLRFGVIPTRINEPEICVADTTYLRGLGWKPQVSLACGVERALANERTVIQNFQKDEK